MTSRLELKKSRTPPARHTERAGPRPGSPPTCTALAPYRRPTPPARTAGLSVQQAAEIERIQTRYGHSTWRQRSDGTVLVTVYGEQPLPSDPRLVLVMRDDGTIARASGRARSIPQPAAG